MTRKAQRGPRQRALGYLRCRRVSGRREGVNQVKGLTPGRSPRWPPVWPQNSRLKMGESSSAKWLAESQSKYGSSSAHSKLLDFAHASHVFLVIARDTQVSVVAVIDILFVNAIKAVCFRNFPRRDTRRRLTRVCMIHYLR